MKNKIFLLIAFLIIAITHGQAQNLALSKTVVASTADLPAIDAVDGNDGTRWASASADPQWIYVDLGQSYSIGQVVLNWETAYGSAYTIDVSDDAATWTTIYTEAAGDGGVDDLSVTGTGRYVRMYGTARGTGWGYSLYEFEVYEEVAIESDATLSDLLVDGTTIDGFGSGTLDYTYGLASGASIPTVTATATNDGNAPVVITAATTIPGTTTVLVTSQDGTANNTYNIDFVYTSPATAAPTPPARNAADVIAIFTQAYDTLTGTNFNPFWNQSTVVTIEDIASIPTLSYANFNFQGTNLEVAQNASGMEFLHVDMWTNDATVVKVTPISPGGTVSEFLVDLTPIVSGSWQSYDIPVSDFTDGGMVLSSVNQLKFDGQAGVNPSNIYLDNIYFHKAPSATEADTTLSDLQVDGTTIDNFSPNTYNYTVGLVEGTTAVPTITATATQDASGATAVVTPATSIPGSTTILVTAVNGTNTATYTVDFAITSPASGAPIPPSRNAEDVISIFSDAYTDVLSTNFNPDWGQATVYSTEDIAGNPTLKYASFNYQGTQFTSQNVTAHDTLHFDMWTADATSVNVWCVSPGPIQKAQALTIVPGEWQSYDIPLSYFADVVDMADVFQFKFDGGNGAQTIFLDNLYFYREEIAPGTDANLSDLTLDGTTIEGFASNTTSYSVIVNEGDPIPTVAATASDDGNASVSITPAAAVPGTTTILVTADDGTTTKTYSVNFTLPPVSNYCETEVTHLNLPAETATAINLTITNIDATTIFVEIESADSDPVDLLSIELVNGTAPVISDADISVPGKISRTISWTTPPTDVSMQLLWSKESFAGNWMLTSFSVPFAAYCEESTDATLSDLLIDGSTVTGFDASELSYNVELAYGTTIVPTVTATTTDDDAGAVVNAAASLPGTTEVVVTAEDGTTTLTYSIAFTIADPSDDATLSDLLVDGSSVEGFISSTYDYTMELAYGTTTVPTVTATENDANANAVVNAAASVPGTTEVVVTAEDGTTILTYSVEFTIAAPSDDATLSDIFIDAVSLPGFDPATYSYNLELAFGTTDVPVITANSNHINAEVNITEAASLPGTTTIAVTAEDGTTILNYSVNMTVRVAVSDDATLDNLLVDGTSIAGFDPGTLAYTLELAYGTTTVPTVTAATNDLAADAVISPASSLPGTTNVIVTAEDGTTELTYTVEFTLASPNTDATLSDLQVDGTTVTGFSASTYTYSIELAYGTTTVPTVTAIENDATANAVVTPIGSLPGTTVVVVTAQDGTTELTYSVEFTIAPNTDATLSDLQVDGTTVTGFAASTYEYSVELAYGTTTVPTVTATENDLAANAVVTPASSLPGTTNIVVTAEDGSTALTYSVEFTIAANNDATLSDLSVDGESISDFDPATLSYTIELAANSTEVPSVTAIPTDDNAGSVVTDAAALPGTTNVVVTAEDGTELTYTVEFTLAASSAVSSSIVDNLSIYSVNELLYVNCSEELLNGKITVYELSGQELTSQKISSTKEQINISSKGMLIVRITNSEEKHVITKKLLIY